MEQRPSWEANSFSARQEIPLFYGARRFITAFTTARHLSLSWASSIQSMAPSHILKIHFNIILPHTPGSPKRSPSLGSPHQNPVCTSLFPRTCHMPRPSHSSRFIRHHLEQNSVTFACEQVRDFKWQSISYFSHKSLRYEQHNWLTWKHFI
jgi:hypothetical protein